MHLALANECSPLDPDPDLLHEKKPRRFLVAEDDAEMRRLMVTVLRKDGAEVVEATGGTALLDWAMLAARNPSHEVFDAIISDIQMPELTALDVLRRVPGVSRGAPVILVTAFGNDDVCERAYALGAKAVLRKPLHPDDLRAVVRAVVRFDA